MNKQDRSDEEENKELLKVIAEQNHEKILQYDIKSDEMVVYSVVQGQFVTLYRTQEYIEQKRFGSVFVAPEDKKNFQKAIRTCLSKPTHTVVDARFIEHKGADPEWHRFYLVSMGGEDNKVERIVGRFISVHEEKVYNEQMRHRAEIDVLTNVYNHKAFEELCEKTMGDCRSNAVFIMLDVDDFKMINDTQGHAVGDFVLSQIGAVLNTAIGEYGIVGRLGGDEFAAFMWNFSDKSEMEEFCKKLQENLKLTAFDMKCSASIGVSVLAHRKVHFKDVYYEADQALYAAKRNGKNQIVFFEDMDKEMSQENALHINGRSEKVIENEGTMLEKLQQCLEILVNENYQNGVQSVLFSLMEYFDADSMMLVHSEDNVFHSVKVSNKESAQLMTEKILGKIQRGEANQFLDYLEAESEVQIADVKSLKDKNELLYEKLAEDRIWSVIAAQLCESEKKIGVLFALNPRRHLEEAGILHMVGGYLTLRLLHENMIQQRAYDLSHDPVTGLWNRDSYTDWFRENQTRSFDSFGIVTTDVVHLAEINQQLGYFNGNKKLEKIAEILQDVFEGNKIFRYDEDEMLVICPNISRQEMELLVKELDKHLEKLEIAVAMGYSWSIHPHIREQITEAEVIMKNDKLKLMHGTTVSQRLEQSIIDEVEDLLKRGRYLIYLQPKVNIHTGKTEGAEALVRQIDDELGIVGPNVFIPVLEHYNLIHMIDLFVLEEVFRYQSEQMEAGHRVVPISVNFSKMTIMYPELMEKVRALTQQYNIPEGLIHIEVTETVGDMDHVVIENVANNLKDLGFRLSMDDFGSHYSNLSVLIQYDFDSAKIDRSMVLEITKNQKSRIVLDYMTSLINDLGIHCIVEGIETKEQVEILRNMKAEMIQGFYFGKPVPKEEFYDTFMA